MSESLSWFITLADAIVSAFYTTFNFIKKFWYSIFIYLFIFFLIVIAYRILKTIFARRRFVKNFKEACEENGAEMEILNNVYLSILFNVKGYDLKITHNGIVYRIKFYPGFIYKRMIHVHSAHESNAPLIKWWAVMKMKRGAVAGRRKKLDYDNECLPNTVNVLLMSPDPACVTETFINGEIWERDVEYGNVFDGVYIFTDTTLTNQLMRVLQGYIPSLTKKKNSDLE